MLARSSPGDGASHPRPPDLENIVLLAVNAMAVSENAVAVSPWRRTGSRPRTTGAQGARVNRRVLGTAAVGRERKVLRCRVSLHR